MAISASLRASLSFEARVFTINRESREFLEFWRGNIIYQNAGEATFTLLCQLKTLFRITRISIKIWRPKAILSLGN